MAASLPNKSAGETFEPSNPPESSPEPGSHTDSDDQALARLRAEFTGHRIWRSTRWDELPGEWVATLRDPDAGVDLTVMQPSAMALHEALTRERARAGRERKETR